MGRHLFVDIDGVVLGTPPGTRDTALAPGAEDLISFGLEAGACSWLSTHGASGDPAAVMRRLRPFLTDHQVPLFERVVAARWDALKTRALPFGDDFYWLDDRPLRTEVDELARHAAADRWLRVDTRRDWLALHDVVQFLRNVWG